MLLRLLPDHIVKYWPEIEFAIRSSVPVETLARNNKLVNILESLLSGAMQCWWLVGTVNGEPGVLACLTTTIYSDLCSKTNSLRLYSLFGYEDIPDEMWSSSLATIMSYAKSNNCEIVDTFTENPYIVKRALEFNGKANLTYVVMEV